MLNNIGLVWSDVGNIDEAMAYFEKCLPIQREVGSKRGEATALSNIGHSWSRLGEKRKAIGFYERALPIYTAEEDSLGEATVLSNLGTAWSALGEKRKALDFFDRSISILRRLGNPWGEETLLNNIGLAWSDLGEKKRALGIYTQALTLSRQVGDLSGEATVLTNIGLAWSDLGQDSVATSWMKLAVNVWQALRTGSAGISSEADRSMLQRVKPRFDTLHDLLIGQGRIAEAMQVLAMQEASKIADATRGDPAIADTLKTRLSLTRLEKKWIAQYDAAAKPIGELGREREMLMGVAKRSPEQLKRLKELERDLAGAQTAFQSTLDAMAKAFQNPEPNANDIEDMRRDENLASLAADLSDATGHPTALLLTLVAERSTHLMLVLPSGSPILHEVRISRKELSGAVAAALADLTNPSRSPFATSKKLYDWIIEPFAKDLAGARIQCLMCNLNGPLRYVPPAAFWDGSAFLAERMQITGFSLVARQYLDNEPSRRPWKCAFFGLSQPASGFAGLPGVVEETSAGAKAFGVEPRLDGAFNRSALDSILKGRETQLVHFGTHFNLAPGSNDETYMVLGGGEKWRLSELESSDALGFRGVELLVAAACDTGVPTGDDSSIEGFGAYCQIKGARSILSTLWKVSDAGTTEWMKTFYRLLGSGVGKGEAFHRAQLALISGRSAESIALPSGDRSQATDRSGQGNFKPDPKRPFAHPYYWAPFVFSGNWR